jgi:hypothetical protein
MSRCSLGFTLIEMQVYLFLLFILGMSVSSLVVRITKETNCSALSDRMHLKAHLLFDRIRRDLLSEEVFTSKDKEAAPVEFYIKNKKLIRKVGNSRATISDKVVSINIVRSFDKIMVSYTLEGGHLSKGREKPFVWWIRKSGVYKVE